MNTFRHDQWNGYQPAYRLNHHGKKEKKGKESTHNAHQKKEWVVNLCQWKLILLLFNWKQFISIKLESIYEKIYYYKLCILYIKVKNVGKT